MQQLKFILATLLTLPLVIAQGERSGANSVVPPIAKADPVSSTALKQATTATDQANLLQVQGILESGDTVFESDGRLFDEYTFVGRRGQSVTITLQSTDFDPYLTLIGTDGASIAENDDISEADLNSRVTFTLPADGTYRVITSSYDDSGRGRYNLNVTTILGTGDLQATLRWNTTDDLDLAIVEPGGEIVHFDNTPIASGGQLDVDANALCEQTTSTPVENVFWPPEEAPRGDYQIQVSLYQRCANRNGAIPFTLILQVQGTTQTLNGIVDEDNQVVVFTTTVN